MKLYRNAIILIVVLGLLSGAYVLIGKNKGTDSVDTQGGTDKKIDTVTNFKKDDITEITITNMDQKFVFAKEKDGWKVISPVLSNVDKSKIDTIASDISNIIGLKVIEENAKDLSKYGLDQPVIVSAKLKDGSVKTVELGKRTATGEAYYAKLAGTGKVYTIGLYTGNDFRVTVNDLKDRGVFSQIKREDISGFSISKDGKKVYSVKKVTDTRWKITEPLQCNADMSKLSAVLDKIPEFSVSEYVEKGSENLQKYGLLNPAYTMEIVTPKGTTKVLLGSEKVRGEEIYAKLDGSDDVFIMDESSLNFLDKPVNDIIDTYIYVANFPDISTMVLEIDGKVIDATIESSSKEDSKNDKYTVNGKDVTELKDDDGESLFARYARTIMGISMSDLELGAKPKGEPEIIVTYNLKKAPDRVKLEFVSRDSSYYYVLKNNKYTGMLVAKSDLNEKGALRETYKKLLKALGE